MEYYYEDDEESGSFHSSHYEFGEQRFNRLWSRIADNDPRTTQFAFSDMGDDDFDFLYNIRNVEWGRFGRDISNNTHLQVVDLNDIFCDNEGALELFLRGLVGSTSISRLGLENNRMYESEVYSLEPFLQNSCKLTSLGIGRNFIGSDGFNSLLIALRDSSIEELWCSDCYIESIEIKNGELRNLKKLCLSENFISIDGCREIAKLLQREDATLEYLDLSHNKIGDDGVAILVDALRNNTSLKNLRLIGNDGISKEGEIMFLKLLNDVSSITSTIHSNHTLHEVYLTSPDFQDRDWNQKMEVLRLIDAATDINGDNDYVNNPEAVWGRKLQMQLGSRDRAELGRLQGVSPTLYSEIDPLLLPEVLALIWDWHGFEELFVSLKSSIADVISIVNKKKYIKQRLAYLLAEVEELRTELKKIELEEED